MRLAPALSREGWNVYRLLVMVRDRSPERAAPRRARGRRSTAPAGPGALAAFRREQPFGWQEEAVQQLTAMDERYGRALRARDFAVAPEDPAAPAGCTPRDGLAQVDEVGTVERRRGRGHASAAVLAAVDTARAERCDPIFLLTDAADWPQQLYERLGFSPIGQLYEFLKLPLGRRAVHNRKPMSVELTPCIVQDARTGEVLTLAYMNDEAQRRTRETGEIWFWSRSRQELWHKGETSGNDDAAAGAALRLRRGRPARAGRAGRPGLPHR